MRNRYGSSLQADAEKYASDDIEGNDLYGKLHHEANLREEALNTFK